MTPRPAPSPTRIPDTKEPVTTPVTGGRCKLQWKPDWAMRWVALGVDYEMAGKDLIELGEAVRRNLPRARRHAAGRLQLRAVPRREGPEDFEVEGQRPDHRRMAALRLAGSLSLFMYREPKAAKRLYFDVIPRHVDEYQQFLDGYQRQDAQAAAGNPVWHIHAGDPPQVDMPITFSMLLTLVSSSNAENAETLWGFIGRYRPGVTPQTHPKLDALVGYAIHYFRDFVLPDEEIPRADRRRARGAARSARRAVAAAGRTRPPKKIQNVVYEIGRREPFLDQSRRQGEGRQAGRLARLVQHALSGAARAGERPALRLVRRGLRRCRTPSR